MRQKRAPHKQGREDYRRFAERCRQAARTASTENERIELLAGALAEQDLNVTFLATARAAKWHPGGSGSDGSAQIASDAASDAALALLAGDVEAERTDDVAARMAALARFPGLPVDTTGSGPDDGSPAEVPAPRSHHSGGWSAGV